MEIKKYEKGDIRKVYEYWQRLGTSPYFFPVSSEHWHTCLLNDELNGERLFKHIETYFATVAQYVVGLVQYGQPYFAWDANGHKHYHPHVGVIRQLYYEQDWQEVGEALLEQAVAGLAGCGPQYAFYHILGMSCNAHHGKLHSSQGHIGQLLGACGFQIEHENAYYVLDMRRIKSEGQQRLHLRNASTTRSEERFEVWLSTEVVGTAQVRYVDRLTVGYTRDTAYLTWIAIEPSCRGQGVGTEFMQLLVGHLLRAGYRYLHTDTASDNIGAQRFYERLGFEKSGHTRSYKRL